MEKIYKTKHILNEQKHGDGGWFWAKYSTHPYMGCQWGCVYCYCRDEKYNPHKLARDPEVAKFKDPFSEYFKIKEGAPELLRKALAKKPKDLIYLSGYTPVEEKYGYLREMLKVCLDLGFPVFINEKSPLVLRDMDLLKKIAKKSYLNVGWSIVTAVDDATRKVFEPLAPTSAARFGAIKELADNGLMTGTIYMPILPFIYDDEESIQKVVKKTKESGGQYVLDGGLTLWGYCGDYYYDVLQKYDPKLVKKYRDSYRTQKGFAEYTAKVHGLVKKYCEQYELKNYIPREVSYFPKELRLNKELAGKFHLMARETQMSGEGGYREWAYRRAGWALEGLDENVADIYKAKGLDGLLEIEGIGKSLGQKLAEYLDKDQERG